MKVVCEILLIFVLIVGVSSNANALKDMEQQMKREVQMTTSTNGMGDGKTLGDVANVGFANLQQYGSYPNYAGLGLQGTGPGFMLNAGGFGGPAQFPGSVQGATPGFAGAGLPAGAVPYGMNYEVYPGNGAASSFMFGGAYPTTIPAYPGTAQAPAAPFTYPHLQGFNQQPGQLPAQSQFPQQQQSQFLPPQLQQQLQQIPAYPAYYSQFGYSPAYKSYQYSIGAV